MPRKTYKPKNRFRPGSRIGEYTYLCMIYFWCHGYNWSEISQTLAQYAKENVGNDYAQTVRRLCELKNIDDLAMDEIAPLSRGVVSRNINEICAWIYLFDDTNIIIPEIKLTAADIERPFKVFQEHGDGDEFEGSLFNFLKASKDAKSRAYFEMYFLYAIMSQDINHEGFRSKGIPPIDVIYNKAEQSILNQRWKNFGGVQIEDMVSHAIWRHLATKAISIVHEANIDERHAGYAVKAAMFNLVFSFLTLKGPVDKDAINEFSLEELQTLVRLVGGNHDPNILFRSRKID